MKYSSGIQDQIREVETKIKNIERAYPTSGDEFPPKDVLNEYSKLFGRLMDLKIQAEGEAFNG